MNQAVLFVTEYLRSISRAATPFLLAHISKTTNIHLRRLILVPWKIVPVSTLNCFRHAPQNHRRRSLLAPVRVLRLMPFSGVRKWTRGLLQWGRTAPTGSSPRWRLHVRPDGVGCRVCRAFCPVRRQGPPRLAIDGDGPLDVTAARATTSKCGVVVAPLHRPRMRR